MAVGPITWGEIGSYNTETLAFLTVWEKRLIRRCDDAYEAVRTGAKPKPTNVAGMKASLRAAIAARNAKPPKEIKK
jgi:hypothetical protein